MEGEALLESIGCWRSINRGTGTSDSGRRSISNGISFWSRVSRGTATMGGAASAEAPATIGDGGSSISRSRAPKYVFILPIQPFNSGMIFILPIQPVNSGFRTDGRSAKLHHTGYKKGIWLRKVNLFTPSYTL
jgi:hypothetical protein